jgi:hypothetical protein
VAGRADGGEGCLGGEPRARGNVEIMLSHTLLTR